jgi:hypothetical protein
VSANSGFLGDNHVVSLNFSWGNALIFSLSSTKSKRVFKISRGYRVKKRKYMRHSHRSGSNHAPGARITRRGEIQEEISDNVFCRTLQKGAVIAPISYSYTGGTPPGEPGFSYTEAGLTKLTDGIKQAVPGATEILNSTWVGWQFSDGGAAHITFISRYPRRSQT